MDITQAKFIDRLTKAFLKKHKLKIVLPPEGKGYRRLFNGNTPVRMEDIGVIAEKWLISQNLLKEEERFKALPRLLKAEILRKIPQK